MKSLFKTVAFVTIFSAITRALGFLFRIYLSRALSVEELGLYQVALSVFMVLLTVVSSGLPVVISKMTAKYHAEKDKTSEGKLVSTSLIISLIASLVLILIVLIFKSVFIGLFADERCFTILLILLPAVLFAGVYSVFRGAMWGHSNYFSFCLTELAEQVIRILLCVFMITFSFFSLTPMVNAGLSLTIASLLSAILAMILYFTSGGKLKKPSSVYKQVLKSTSGVTGVRVASSLAQPIIALILPARLIASGYTNSQALSLYGVAMGMTVPLLFIPITLVGSLSMVLIPDLSAAVANKDKEYVKNRINSSIIFTLLITFLLIPLYIGAGDNIGLFFFDNLQSGQLLSSSAWVMLPFALLNITSAILNALGQEVKSFVNYLIGSIFLFIGIIFLPKFIGIRALPFAMGICVFVASLLNLRMINKKLDIKVLIWKHILKLCLISVPTMAITYFLTNVLSTFIPLFFNLAISCSIGGAMFVLLCIIFKICNVQALYFEFKNKFKTKIKVKKKT